MEVPELCASEITLSQTKPAKSRYKYNAKWESHTLFANWVQPVEEDPTKALCTFCNVKLLARYNFLCKHRETFKHRKRDPNVKEKERKLDKMGSVPLFFALPRKDSDTTSPLKIIRVQTESNKASDPKRVLTKRQLERFVQVPTPHKKIHIAPGWEGKLSIVTIPSPCCRNIKYIRSLTKVNIF